MSRETEAAGAGTGGCEYHGLYHCSCAAVCVLCIEECIVLWISGRA